jgi:hypothetical protein
MMAGDDAAAGPPTRILTAGVVILEVDAELLIRVRVGVGGGSIGVGSPRFKGKAQTGPARKEDTTHNGARTERAESGEHRSLQ